MGHQGRGRAVHKGREASLRRTAAALTVATVLGVSLAGCNNNDSDDPPDSGLPSGTEVTESTPTTPATEPTPTEATGPTPPELPEAATRHTKAGAKAFVRFYLRLLNYATHTGDVEPLRLNSTNTCTGCSDDAEFYEKLYKRGGWARGLVRSLSRVVAMSPAQPEDVYVGVEIRRTRGVYKLSGGSKTKTLPKESSRLDFYLVQSRDHWKMGRVERPT